MNQVGIKEEVHFSADFGTITGDITIPVNSNKIIIFSHGSGSSRFSPRNKKVAEFLNEKGFATLLLDLLTEDEDQEFKNRFNIFLLADRLEFATRLVMESNYPNFKSAGYFGASTGAASALMAAARMGNKIRAVVSRGGRPDLAMQDLNNVISPTLLIVGSLDYEVIGLNLTAFNKLKSIKKYEIVKGATHLFEEPGKMDEVSFLAEQWFEKYL